MRRDQSLSADPQRIAFGGNRFVRLPRIKKRKEGISIIVKQLAAAGPAVIVIESTGGLERLRVDALLDADLPVALVHSGRVRYFAKGLGMITPRRQTPLTKLLDRPAVTCSDFSRT